jgi:hypothetical protein
MEFNLKNVRKGFDFVIDYFENNPLTKEDMPDINLSDIRESWIKNNDIAEYIDNYNYMSYFDFDSYKSSIYEELNDSEKSELVYIYTSDIIDFIEDLGDDINVDLYDLSENELIVYLDTTYGWNNYFEKWFNENVSSNFLEEYIDSGPFSIDELLDFVNVDVFMEDLSTERDDEDLIKNYYENR